MEIGKLKIIVKSVLFLFALFLILPSFAGGVGYIDYQKVFENYQYAKTSMREIQNKEAEIQKYLDAKEAEFDKLETPVQKKKFQASVQAEMKTKEAAFNDFREKKDRTWLSNSDEEEAVYQRIHAVTEKIRLVKGLDAVLDARSVFSGGVDITDTLIKTLNSGSAAK